MPKFLFDQNLVYHSYLKRHSPLVIRFSTAGIMDSKYQEDQKIIYFDIRGFDDDGRYYLIENDQCLERIRNAPLGQWLKVSATGSADEPGDLIIEETSGGAGNDFDLPDSPSNYSRGNVLDDFMECTTVAGDYFDVATDGDGSLTDLGLRIATTLYIQWSRRDFKMPLTADMANTGSGEQVEEESESPSLSEEVVQAMEVLRDQITWEGEAHDGTDLDARLNQINEFIDDPGTVKDAQRINAWMKQEVEAQKEAEKESVSVGAEDDLPF